MIKHSFEQRCRRINDKIFKLVILKTNMSLYLILTFCLVYTHQTCCFGYTSRSSAKDDYRQAMYNSITPYRFVQNLLQYGRVNEGSTAFYKGRTCHIVNMNLLLRHGSRSPWLHEIKRINNLDAKLKNIPQVAYKFPLIKRWKNPFPEDQPYTQLGEGDREQALLARRFGMMFQNLFQDNLNRIKYVSTTRGVAIQSYEVFSDSLNDHFRANIPRPRAEIDNKKLYFYKQCKNFDKLSKMARDQYNLFLVGPEMKSVVEKVRNKLGTNNITTGYSHTNHLGSSVEQTVANLPVFHEIKNLHQISQSGKRIRLSNKTEGIIKTIMNYTITAIDGIQVKETTYIARTKNPRTRYWQRSYGIRLNAQISCPFTSNLFDKFNAVVQNGGSSMRHDVAEIGFAHGFSMVPIMTAFGLYKDTSPFLASNFETHKQRLLQIAKINPMSGNLAVALYKCDGYDAEYVVRMFVNEEPVDIPKCGCKVCPYYKFRALYKSLGRCDFEGLCEN